MNDLNDTALTVDPGLASPLNATPTEKKEKWNRVKNKVGPENEEMFFEKGLHEGGPVNDMNSDRDLTPFGSMLSWENSGDLQSMSWHLDTPEENKDFEVGLDFIGIARNAVSDEVEDQLEDVRGMGGVSEPEVYTVYTRKQVADTLLERLPEAVAFVLVQYEGMWYDIYGVTPDAEVISDDSFFGLTYITDLIDQHRSTASSEGLHTLFIYLHVPTEVKKLYRDFLGLDKHLHVTLAYRDDITSDKSDRNSLLKQLSSIAKTFGNVPSSFGGLAQFNNPDSSIVTLVNINGGAELYSSITQAIENVYGPWKKEYDFIPHCTLDAEGSRDLGDVTFHDYHWVNDSFFVKFDKHILYQVVFGTGDIIPVPLSSPVYANHITAAPETYTDGSDVNQESLNNTPEVFHQRTLEGDFLPGAPEVDYHYFPEIRTDIDDDSGEAYKATASLDEQLNYDPERGDKFHWEPPDEAGESSSDMTQSWNAWNELPDVQKEEKETGTSTFEGRENLSLWTMLNRASIKNPYIEYNSEDSDETKFYKYVLKIARSISHCGDYGHVYWNPKTSTIWWVAGDADGELSEGYDTTDMIREKFMTIPEVKDVKIEFESSPKEEDWLQIDAEIAPTVSSLQVLSWDSPKTDVTRVLIGVTVSRDDPSTVEDIRNEYTKDIDPELLDRIQVKVTKPHIVDTPGTTGNSDTIPFFIHIIGYGKDLYRAMSQIEGMTPDLLEHYWNQRELIKSDDPAASLFGTREGTLYNISGDNNDYTEEESQFDQSFEEITDSEDNSEVSEEASEVPEETKLNISYINPSDIIEAHNEVLQHYGGRPGISEQGVHKLEAAIGRMQSAFGEQEFYTSVLEKAAVLAHSIITSHPFIDGNKRTAYISIVLFLHNNNFQIDDSEDLADLIIKLSSTGGTHKELYKWLEDNAIDLHIPTVHKDSLERLSWQAPKSYKLLEVAEEWDVTAQAFFRSDPHIAIGRPRTERINIKTNSLFNTGGIFGDGVESPEQIKETYESFWNGMNSESEEIVKVLNVQPVGALD